jgi:hypothetical protein
MRLHLRALAICTLIAGLALFVGPGPAQEKSGQAQQVDEGKKQTEQEKTEQEKKESGFGIRPSARPPMRAPTAVRPTTVTRPTMRAPQQVRPTTHVEQPRTATQQRQRALRATKKQPETGKRAVTKSKEQEPTINRAVTKPNEPQPTINRAVVPEQKPVLNERQTVSQPVQQGNTFVGKPDNVAHNPLRTGGDLGRMHNHQPVVIEKYGRQFRRSYYSTAIGGVPAWYWYDTPLLVDDPIIRTLREIPVCDGDTEKCNPRPVIADGPQGPTTNVPQQTTYIETETKCPDGILRARAAWTDCVDGNVVIKAKDYYFCKSTGQGNIVNVPDVKTGATCNGKPSP